ncbi:hypothetical protein ISN45_Aa03g010820 [Arabidopsis thaliana x Arabidopsis arenosa]|uniref:Uncharacterized protein n=1 Tax=Arabidopsis thaliana x Arabidopsis arenosa TaxID=1240361 RepID=A0A8T2ARX7_9BRAS|nr:hypothetical protein ISN45_Aa03g010820 [Arabidopsis thaliana x Arabidopsis arenosa]
MHQIKRPHLADSYMAAPSHNIYNCDYYSGCCKSDKFRSKSLAPSRPCKEHRPYQVVVQSPPPTPSLEESQETNEGFLLNPAQSYRIESKERTKHIVWKLEF